MLRSLRVENLLLIESAEMEPAAGLNVLTGETGAGKTLLATALGLIMGDRCRTGLVRPGATEAWVEGVFDRIALDDDRYAALLPEGEEELVLARRIWPDGRSRAMICGRTATVGDLRGLSALLIGFHGQHEHRRLTLASFQLDTLDRSCGPKQLELRTQARKAATDLRLAAADLESIVGSEGDRERQLDILRFELDEIEGVNPAPGEMELLRRELSQLRNADRIASAVAEAAHLIEPADDSPGAASAVGHAENGIAQLAEIDPGLADFESRLESLRLELAQVARDMRDYLSGVSSSPERLAELEERTEAILRLERKHGGSLESVLAHADACRERISQLEDAEGNAARLTESVRAARQRQSAISRKLHSARVSQAPRLAAAVTEALAGLGLEGASFDIRVDPAAAVDSTGGDRVEFLVAPNPGIPLGSLAEIASGGEVSRILLALLTVSQADADGERSQRLLVFDEIDAGVGGRTARAVGERLRELGTRSQVICITHLPQVAAMAQRHFMISKRSSDGGTSTSVSLVEGEQTVDEVVRMLGADSGDSAARAHAVELLDAA